MKGILGVLAAIVIMAAMFFSSYNGLVSMNENVTGKWSQVENQLQRRNDLIPNLVNTVKGQAVSDARAKLGGAKTVAETTAANNEMNSALSRLLVVAENYPDLKSNNNFQQLQDELAGTENRIAVARKDYNDAVQVYNAKIKSLPTSLYAGACGFTAKDYFKADAAAQKVPQVKF